MIMWIPEHERMQGKTDGQEELPEALLHVEREEVQTDERK